MSRKWFSLAFVLAWITTGAFSESDIGSAGDQAACLPLTKPALTAPANETIIFRDQQTGQIPESIKLQWEALPGVQLYRVEIYKSAFGSLPGSATAATNEIALGDMLNGPTWVQLDWYFWRVARQDLTDGCPLIGEYSELRAFRVVDNLVFKPVNLQASDGTYSDRVKLTWELDTSDGLHMPETFSIIRTTIGDYPTNTKEIASRLSPDVRAYEDTGLVANEKYHYRVVSVHSVYGTQVSYGDTGFITPACVPVGTPQLWGPEDGTEIWLDPDGSTEDILYWYRVPGVEKYEIYIRDINKGDEFTEIVEWNAYNFYHHKTGTYAWRVRALSPVEGCDEISEWSETWTFKFYITRTYPVIDMNASDGVYADKVVLTWAIDLNRTDEYVEYRNPDYFTINRLDRFTGEEIQFQETVAFVPLESHYRFEDRTVVSGRIYEYSVTSDREIGYVSTGSPDEGWASAQGVLQFLYYLPIIGK